MLVVYKYDKGNGIHEHMIKEILFLQTRKDLKSKMLWISKLVHFFVRWALFTPLFHPSSLFTSGLGLSLNEPLRRYVQSVNRPHLTSMNINLEVYTNTQKLWKPNQTYRGFIKWWYPTTIGFPTKNHHFGMLWGYHHLSKPPYQTWMASKFVSTLFRFRARLLAAKRHVRRWLHHDVSNAPRPKVEG